MKILNFLSSLLPSFTKSRLKEDLDTTKEELKNTTLPAYKSAFAFGIDKRKWKSEAVIQHQDRFDKAVKTKFRGNAVKVTSDILQVMEKNIPVVEKMVEDYYADDVTRDAMTYLGANLIQFLELMTFTVRYARRQLYWILTEEATNADPEYVADSGLTPGEIEWLMKKRETFFHALNVLAMDAKDMEKAFKDIPDIVATKDNVEIVSRTAGAHKIDPFGMAFIPAWINPIYYVRMAIAEWQVARYKAAKEEVLVIQQRLIQLKSMEEGKRPANVAQQIEYHSGRLKKLEADIAEMEQNYG